MNRMLTSTGSCWLWLILVVLVLDFSSKRWVMYHFYLGESVLIVPFMNFSYYHNSGAAFSILADKSGWQRLFFILITIMVTIVLSVMMYHSECRDYLSKMAYSMIIGGALGNLFDRIVYGVVIDFIDFYIGNWHWPIFNVADLAICVGAILMASKSFLSCQPDPPNRGDKFNSNY